jgi:hypothetical protein
MDTEENTIIDFKSALEFLNQASQTFKTDVFIPSLDKTLSFKEIDAKQQKELLSAAMDNNVYNTSFIKTFYNILKDNLLDSDKNIIDELTICDKACVAISLRKQISDDLTIIFDEKNNITQKVDINDVLNKFKSFETPKSQTLELSNSSVLLKAEVIVPSVKVEVDYDNEINKNKKKTEEIKTQEDVKQIISEAFIFEISKYMNKIWINDTEINLNDIKLSEKNKLIEKLPSGLIQKVLEQINAWKKDLDSVLTVKFEEHTKVIAIDSILFLN